MWEIETQKYQKAMKEYHCEASDWIGACNYSEYDFKPKDWGIIKNAEKENFKILKGTMYLKISGKWEGEFCVFRARTDLDEICIDYELYNDK